MPEPKRLTAEEFAKIVDRDTDQLVATLNKRDDLVPMVLRFHLLAENLLERIILAKIAKGHVFLENATPTFHHKLELVNALDVMDSATLGALRKINRLRNSSAHTADLSISVSEVEAIGRPLGKKFVAIRSESGDNTERLLITTLASVWGGILKALYLAEHADTFPWAKAEEAQK